MKSIRLGLAVAAFGVPLARLLVAVRCGNLAWGVIRDELRLLPMDRQ